MDDICVGFIGFGLIGGSIARALREKHPNYTLIAYNYRTGPNPNLIKAKEDGCLNEIYSDLAPSFAQCDLIFLCAPVIRNISYLERLKTIIKPTCILTDVGSVKGNIHNAVKEIGLERQFIGGHPMAGSEKTGYLHSTSTLLQNAYYILTPTEETPKESVEIFAQYVKEFGAIPITLSPKQHDDATALVSHVPHIIAATLVNTVRNQDTKDGLLHSLAAGGFKDITRIASSSPVMWENICITNRNSILQFLSCYEDTLHTLIQSLKDGDETRLIQYFEQAKEYRDSIPHKSVGTIEKVFEIYVDIIDETGAIATIATILASNNVSIKNIGIVHNREFEGGVLRIELYEESARMKTVSLLNQYHYTIYER